MQNLGWISGTTTAELPPVRAAVRSSHKSSNSNSVRAETSGFRATTETVRPASPTSADIRHWLACRRNWLYFAFESHWARLPFSSPKKILFSGMPEWMGAIRNGFGGLPHQVEFGPIVNDSFQNYDVVVPLSLSAIKEARRYSSAGKTSLPLPSAEAVRLCDDKYELNLALIKAGFSQYIPEMAMGRALTPPYILKKRVGSWGKDCYIIRNYCEEASQRDRIKHPDYFCQEFLPGTTEFATHILFVEDKIAKALEIKYEFASDAPIKGQDEPTLTVVHHCPYLRLFSDILRAIGYEGLCCINYKLVKGQLFLFEINPRFGGSLAPYFFSFARHLH